MPARPSASLERWLTVFVLIGSGLVYLSLFLKSAPVFIVGEAICLLLAPVIIWRERSGIKQWWNARGKCVACGYDLTGTKGSCPGCGRKRIVE